jgi:TonB family protein
MPEAFFKSLLWALILHGGLLGILLFTWSYWGHPISPFDHYQIYKVSLVDAPKVIPLSQGKVQQSFSPGRPALTEKMVSVHQPEASAFPAAKTPALEEKPNIPVEEKGEKGETTGFSFQVVRRGTSSGGAGPGEHEFHSSTGMEESESSPSSPKGTALSSPMAVPRYSLNQRPYYPAMARERGWQGTTRLKVMVLKNGSVGSLQVQHSSGFSILDQAALKGVKEWKFYPGQKDGQPTEMWVQVPVTFRLE